MSYAPLDPKNTVMLFADLQAGIIELTATNELARLRRAVAALAKLARIFAIPAVVTTAPADGGPRVTPEIAAALGELPLHTRNTTDAFLHAPTRDAIAGTRRTTLLIAGRVTAGCGRRQHLACRVVSWVRLAKIAFPRKFAGAELPTDRLNDHLDPAPAEPPTRPEASKDKSSSDDQS